MTEERDKQIFKAIMEHMNECGDPPKIGDLVAIVNSYEGLPDGTVKSVGNATVSGALFRLEEIGLIEMRRADNGRGKRSAGSLRIVDSELIILISQDEANDRIAEHYENTVGKPSE